MPELLLCHSRQEAMRVHRRVMIAGISEHRGPWQNRMVCSNARSHGTANSKGSVSVSSSIGYGLTKLEPHRSRRGAEGYAAPSGVVLGAGAVGGEIGDGGAAALHGFHRGRRQRPLLLFVPVHPPRQPAPAETADQGCSQGCISKARGQSSEEHLYCLYSGQMLHRYLLVDVP